MSERASKAACEHRAHQCRKPLPGVWVKEPSVKRAPDEVPHSREGRPQYVASHSFGSLRSDTKRTHAECRGMQECLQQLCEVCRVSLRPCVAPIHPPAFPVTVFRLDGRPRGLSRTAEGVGVCRAGGSTWRQHPGPQLASSVHGAGEVRISGPTPGLGTWDSLELTMRLEHLDRNLLGASGIFRE